MAVLLDKSANTGGVQKFGGLNNVRGKTASQFTPDADWSVTSIDVSLNEDTGDPVGDITVAIETESASLPSDTSVTNGDITIAAAEVSGSGFTDLQKSFPDTVSLSNGVNYWLVFGVASDRSDAAYYSSDGTGASGNGAKWDEDPTEGSWDVITADLQFILNGTIAAAGPATLKTLDTVAAASVKTTNGTAIASVKTINTAA